MYCENCGQQNNDGSLFCEYCGARMMEPVVSVNPSINNAPIQNKKQKGEKSFAIPIIISLVILAVAGGLLAFFLLRGKGAGPDNDSISYYKAFKEDDVVFPDDGEAYVANQLLVKVSKDMSKDEVEKLIDSYDGEIVGINNVTGIYQVEFSDKSEDELMKIKEDLAGETIVESASLHYVYYNECLIGSDGSLDNSLMGLSDADYDRALVGDLGIVLVGSSVDKTEVDSILTDYDMKEISRDDNSLVSLYEIESEMTQKADEGCEIFEMASNLKPTCDDQQSAYEALNLETANFINSLSENDYDVLMIGLKQSEEESFLVGIDDSKAMRRILTVGGMADQATGIDIVAEGSGAQPMEYATSIAAITWISNRDLNAGNIKDILSNSFVINEDGIGVLDASISVEVAKRLRNYKASTSDGDKELSLEDIMVVINEVKTERGLIETDSEEEVGDDSENSEGVRDEEALEEKLKELVNEMGYSEISYSDPEGDTEIGGGNYQTGIVSASIGRLDGTDVPYMIVFYSDIEGDYYPYPELNSILYIYDGEVKEIDRQKIQLSIDEIEVSGGGASSVSYGSMFDASDTSGNESAGEKHSNNNVKIINENGNHIVAYRDLSGDDWETNDKNINVSVYTFNEEGIKGDGGIIMKCQDPIADYNYSGFYALGLYDNDKTDSRVDAQVTTYDDASTMINDYNTECRNMGADYLCVDLSTMTYESLSSEEDILGISANYKWSDIDYGEYSECAIDSYDITDNTKMLNESLSWWRSEGETSESEVSEEEIALLDITDTVIDDKSGSLEEDKKNEITKAVSEETERYMNLIFTYSEYSDEYKNNLLKDMADTEKYPRTKYYYVDAIIKSFTENEVKCSVNSVNILGVTIYNEVNGVYEVTVRGYIDVNYCSKDLPEDKRYIIFEDHLCKENDNITHFDPYFNYMLKQDGFKYGLIDDGSKTIRYKGTTVYEFNLEQYNPEYEQKTSNDSESSGD